MKHQPGFKTLAGLGAGLLLLGTAWLAQAAITIIRADGFVCTDGTVNVNGTVTPVDASCHDPSITTYTLTFTKAGAGLGTISGAGLTCDGTTGICTATYTAGTAVNVTLNAAPTDGSAITWTGDCTPSGNTCVVSQASVAANLAVTATFTPPPPPPPPGDCGALPANTVVIDTGNLNVSWPQQMFLPVPQQITAFKVTVPSTFSGRDNFATAGTASSTTSKRLVVSTCPGVLTPVGGQSYCSGGGTETTTLRLSTRSSDPSYYCKLTPGSVYYVNAVSKNNLTDTGYNCTTTTNCSFYASRAAPY